MPKLNKEESFFDLLENQAKIAVKASEELVKLINDPSAVQAHTQALEALETDGDKVIHRMQNKLSATFITPLDQEDLSELSRLLDDITDCVEATGARFKMYKLTVCRPDVAPFAERLLDIVKATDSAVAELHHQFHRSATLPDVIDRIHQMESDADHQYRDALTKLFDEVTDAILLLKWKEVYDRIERAFDKCAELADLVENMIVKYA